MNERTKELYKLTVGRDWAYDFDTEYAQKFAELIVRECVGIIESQQVPVGNSAAGEMAADWTIAALSECRTEIKEHFGIK